MDQPSILEYDNYRSFLKDVLEDKVRKNSTFSLRAFARLVGVSPSHLSRTLAGSKRLSATSARQISLALDHNSDEADHFLGLIELEGSATNEQRAKVLQRLTKRAPGQSRVLALEAFRAIADWYHFAILALTQTRGFVCDAVWIARRLKIKPLEAKLAVERLLMLGLLERDGTSVKASNNADISTTVDVSSAAIQENHRQQMALANDALKELAVELREFNNLTVSMNVADVAKAKKMIRTFIDRFDRELKASPGQEVFQLNIQFFQLSDK